MFYHLVLSAAERWSIVSFKIAYHLVQASATFEFQSLPSVKTDLMWLGSNAEPDGFFADIQFADGISFDIFEKFKLNCRIIFITSYYDFVIRAFKVNGIVYLLKPVEWTDLIKSKEKTKCRNQKLQLI